VKVSLSGERPPGEASGAAHRAGPESAGPHRAARHTVRATLALLRDSDPRRWFN